MCCKPIMLVVRGVWVVCSKLACVHALIWQKLKAPSNSESALMLTSSPLTFSSTMWDTGN